MADLAFDVMATFTFGPFELKESVFLSILYVFGVRMLRKFVIFTILQNRNS